MLSAHHKQTFRFEESNATVTANFDLTNVNGVNFAEASKNASALVTVTCEAMIGTGFVTEVQIYEGRFRSSGATPTLTLEQVGTTRESSTSGSPTALTVDINSTNIRVQKAGNADAGNTYVQITVDFEGIRID